MHIVNDTQLICGVQTLAGDDTTQSLKLVSTCRWSQLLAGTISIFTSAIQRREHEMYEMIKLNLCSICFSNLVLCSDTPETGPRLIEKNSNSAEWLSITLQSISTGGTGQRHTHTHTLFVCYDYHLWEYPRQWLNWLQETHFVGSASVPISKESRCTVLPKSQDLFQSSGPEE